MSGMQLSADMIDSGQIDYALIVDGEGSRQPQQATIERLNSQGATRDDIVENFATFTLGSGGAAMVLGRASQHREGHRFLGGVSRAATEHHLLCTGDLTGMRTDSRALLEAAVDLAVLTWADALPWVGATRVTLLGVDEGDGRAPVRSVARVATASSRSRAKRHSSPPPRGYRDRTASS